MIRIILLLCIGWVGTTGCGNDTPATESNEEEHAPEPYKLICLGSTFTVGDTLEPALAYPARLQAAYAANGTPVKVVNAAIRGETVRGAQERIPWLLQQRFDGMLLELGNLEQQRGRPVDSTRQELQQLVATIHSARPDADLFLLDLSGTAWIGRLPHTRLLALPPDSNTQEISVTSEQRVADFIHERLGDQLSRAN